MDRLIPVYPRKHSFCGGIIKIRAAENREQDQVANNIGHGVHNYVFKIALQIDLSFSQTSPGFYVSAVQVF